MVEVQILDRTEYLDLTKGPPGVPSILITFMAPGGRIGSVSISKDRYTKEEERRQIKAAVEKMGPAPGEVISV